MQYSQSENKERVPFDVFETGILRSLAFVVAETQFSIHCGDVVIASTSGLGPEEADSQTNFQQPFPDRTAAIAIVSQTCTST